MSSGRCIIRAPPGSGKTTLAQVICEFVKREGHNAVYINCGLWTRGQNLDDFWRQEVGVSYSDYCAAAATDKLSFVVLDESYLWYVNDDDNSPQGHMLRVFWARMKLDARTDDRVRFIVFATHGHKTGQSSVDWGDDQQFGLSTLLLSQAQTSCLASAIVACCRVVQIYDKQLLGELLYDVTKGYASLSRRILYDLLSNRNDWRPTDEDLRTFFAQKKYYGTLMSTRPCKWLTDTTVPPPFSVEERDRLFEIIERTNLSSLVIDKDAGELVTSRFISCGLFSRRVETDPYSFTSPIMFDTLLEALFSGTVRLQPTAESFDYFIERVLQHMSPLRLRRSIECAQYSDVNPADTNAGVRVDIWQKEFYLTVASVVPRGSVVLQTNAGRMQGVRGAYLDFYLDGTLEWGIELVRDGNNVAEHVSRFTTGRYRHIPMKQWAVLHFCEQRPADSLDHVIYAVYNAQFTHFNVFRKGGDPNGRHLVLLELVTQSQI